MNYLKNLGQSVSINAEDENPVDAVRKLTNGQGADLVIDCVGGHAGVKSFEQAQDMVRQYGIIQLIALYQQKPLPLTFFKDDEQETCGRNIN